MKTLPVAGKVSRLMEQFALPTVLAIGYRVRSLHGSRFRLWATQRLDEVLRQVHANEGRRRAVQDPRDETATAPRSARPKG